MELMTTLYDPFSTSKSAWAGKELTTSQAQECANVLEITAMRTMFSKARPVESAIREYMADNFKGADTTRLEFEEAVRYLIRDKWGV